MKLFLVGGTVRRRMLDLPKTKDLDFAVEAPSFEAMRLGLLDKGLRVWQERPEFVTLRGKLPVGKLGPGLVEFLRLDPLSEVDADFTLCRAEAMYSDKRHPDTVTPADLKTDLSRRDFTVNAVAVGQDGYAVDPFGGRDDAQARVLRTVGAPAVRFAEDPLRMLRAVRFAVTEDMYMCDELQDTLRSKQLPYLLRTLPVERVFGELNRALAHNWRSTMLLLMVDAPILGYVLHEAFPNLWLKATTENR